MITGEIVCHNSLFEKSITKTASVNKLKTITKKKKVLKHLYKWN